MKNRLKILPLALLAAGFLLALSGCDKILETMFPVETGQRSGSGGSGGQNSVSFNVSLPTAGITNWFSSNIVVKLERPDGSSPPQTRSRPGIAGQGGATATMTTTFDFLPDGGYHAYAWLDLNGNNQPDSAEPYGAPSGGHEYFPLPDGGNANPSYDIQLIVPATGGQNEVKAKVKLSNTITGWNANNAVMIDIEKQTGDQIWQPIRRATAAQDPTDTHMGLASFDYTGLPDGDYHAIAWLDTNGNNQLDPTEPQGVPGGGREFFHLPDGANTLIPLDITLVVPAAAGTNTLNVNVWVDQTITGWNNADGVKIQLDRQNDAPILNPIRTATATAAYDPAYPNSGKATFSYTLLPDGQYKATVWLDANGNSIQDAGEVTLILNVPGFGQIFTLGASSSITQTIWLLAPPPASVPKVYLKGPQVLPLGDGNMRNYQLYVLQPPGGTAYVSSFHWSIWGNYSQLANTATGGSFSLIFDPANFMYEGTFTLNVDTVKLDGGALTNSPSMDVRMITEATAGSTYYPYLYLYNFNYDPYYLDSYTAYNVKVEFLDFWGNKPWWVMSYGYPGTFTWSGALYNGYSYLQTYGNPVGVDNYGHLNSNTIASGVDRMRVYIDTNSNGVFTDPDDLVTEVELGVSSSDAVVGYLWLNLPAAQFLKHSDSVNIFSPSPY